MFVVLLHIKTRGASFLLHAAANFFVVPPAAGHTVCKYNGKIPKNDEKRTIFYVSAARRAESASGCRGRAVAGVCPASASSEQRFHPVEQQCPGSEARPFADEHEESGLFPVHAVETERDGHHVAYQREPGEKGEEAAVAGHLVLVLFDGFPFDLEVFLYPLPFAGPAEPVGGETAEPVARRRHRHRNIGVGTYGEEPYQQNVRTHRKNRGGEKGPDEEPYVSVFEQEFHTCPCRLVDVSGGPVSDRPPFLLLNGRSVPLLCPVLSDSGPFPAVMPGTSGVS